MRNHPEHWSPYSPHCTVYTFLLEALAAVNQDNHTNSKPYTHCKTMQLLARGLIELLLLE